MELFGGMLQLRVSLVGGGILFLLVSYRPRRG